MTVASPSQTILTEGFVIQGYVQSVMFGLYVATLAHCLRWLLYTDEGWKIRKKINWPMFGAVILVFVFTIADLAGTLYVSTGLIVGEERKILHRLNVAGVSVSGSFGRASNR